MAPGPHSRAAASAAAVLAGQVHGSGSGFGVPLHRDWFGRVAQAPDGCVRRIRIWQRRRPSKPTRKLSENWIMQ